MPDLKDRLLIYLNSIKLDGNLRNVERLVGLSNGAIDKIGDGTRKQTIDKISTTFPDLNISWLKTGEGEMLKLNKDSFSLLHDNKHHIIRYYDIDASAGNVEMFDPGYIKYKDIVIPGFEDCDIALNVWGDSMYPELKSGQIVALKKWEESYIEFGNVYLVVTKNNHRMIKRIRASKNKDEVICESANEIFDPFEIKKEDILKLYLVKGHIERCAI